MKRIMAKRRNKKSKKATRPAPKEPKKTANLKPKEPEAAAKPSPERRKTRISADVMGLVLLGLALIIGLVARLHLAFTDHGSYWPDEVFQSLEPAHKLVFGYGKIPWEFVWGVRNWAFPGLIAGVFSLLSWLGVDAPESYIGTVRTLLCICGVASGLGVYMLVRAFSVDRLVSAAAATTYLFASTSIYFAHRALSENPSATCVIFGLAFLFRKDDRRRDLIIGACLLGLATLIRVQSGLFCVGILATMLLEKRFRAAIVTFIVMLIWAALYGLLDWWTWGSPFFSAIQYVRFNLVQSGATQFGVEPFHYYFTGMFSAMEVVTVAFAAGAALALRSRPQIPAIALFCILVLSIFAHKELRFIIPVWPLLAASTGIGLSLLKNKKLRHCVAAGLVAISIYSLATHRDLTFGDLSHIRKHEHAMSAYDRDGAVYRLLMKAHYQEDLCGLVLSSQKKWRVSWSSLHRDVSIIRPRRWSNLLDKHHNYILSDRPPKNKNNIIAQDEDVYLIRYHQGPCTKKNNARQRLDRSKRDLPLPSKSLFEDLLEAERKARN